VNPLVAVEIKLWWNKLDAEKANRDVEKLTAVGNKVENAFFLNFVRLGLLEQHSKDNFQSSRAYLVGKKKQWPHLNVLCVPDKAGHQARHLNWL
jgi:hypothetical protein